MINSLFTSLELPCLEVGDLERELDTDLARLEEDALRLDWSCCLDTGGDADLALAGCLDAGGEDEESESDEVWLL